MKASRHGMESEHIFNPIIYLIWVFRKGVFIISGEKYFVHLLEFKVYMMISVLGRHTHMQLWIAAHSCMGCHD